MTRSLHRLDRRRALSAFGALSLGRWLPACGSSQAARGSGAAGGGDRGDGGAEEVSCPLTPEQTQGPFFVDTGLMRSDLREGKPGAVLELSLRVVNGPSCSPVAGALVEVWHADASGVYSGFDVAQGNVQNTLGQTFLRGFQRTSADGRVEFLSIYPGWYPGRTPHVHLTVQVEGRRQRLTTQLYFPDGVTDVVYASEPYAARGARSTTNATDAVGAPAPLIGEVSERGPGYATALRLVVPG